MKIGPIRLGAGIGQSTAIFEKRREPRMISKPHAKKL
jgi:hypothetical protein